MSRRAREDDPTVQACIARCMTLNPRKANRRAKREANKDEINQQNRESRHRREQGAVLLDRVEQAVQTEQNSDDPCQRKLRRLERLVESLQGNMMEQEDRPAPSRTPRPGSASEQLRALIPRLQQAMTPRAQAERQFAPTPSRPGQSRSAASSELVEPERQFAPQQRRPQQRPGALQELEQVPAWVRALRTAKKAGDTQNTWKGPLRNWFEANNIPQPGTPGSQAMAEAALYLMGAQRADRATAGWRQQHGPRAKQLWEQEFGAGRRGVDGGTLSEDVSELTRRVQESGLRLPTGTRLTGTPAQRLTRMAQLLASQQSGYGELPPSAEVERRQSGRLRPVGQTARRSARVPRQPLPDISNIIQRAREMGYSLPPSFTESGATGYSQMASMLGALQIPERASSSMTVPTQQTGRLTAKAVTASKSRWPLFIEENWSKLSATQSWVPHMLKWLESSGYPLEGVSMTGKPTQKDIIATARYLVGVNTPGDDTAQGFVFWRQRFGSNARADYFGLMA